MFYYAKLLFYILLHGIVLSSIVQNYNSAFGYTKLFLCHIVQNYNFAFFALNEYSYAILHEMTIRRPLARRGIY